MAKEEHGTAKAVPFFLLEYGERITTYANFFILTPKIAAPRLSAVLSSASRGGR
ncbi:MAG TPA: hypothetical protein VKQ11_21365 [Candidatus Sulfotelmatobacter sp.]|nr:hypothetical protein [Candidatus Sulfotelmatobacter sp.]